MAKNPSTITQSKRIDISIHYIRDLVNKRAIKVEYIPSNMQLADGFTKNLSSELLKIHRERHNLVTMNEKLIKPK